MHWSPWCPTPEHTPLLPLQLPLCHESLREGGLKGMAGSQKKLCPLLQGEHRWEHGRLSFWNRHRCPPIFALVAPAPDLPLAFSFLFKFSRASLELSPAQPWPSPQRVSDLSPLNSVGAPWSLLLDAVHSGKPNLAYPVTFCASVISRSCQVIGSGKENCSLTAKQENGTL